MAGTVVLDDVELREAQRDYLDFLDDEVREAQGREVPERGAWGGGAAEGGHAGRRSPPGEVGARQACRRRGQAGRRRSLRPDLLSFLAAGSARSRFPVGGQTSESGPGAFP